MQYIKDKPGILNHAYEIDVSQIPLIIRQCRRVQGHLRKNCVKMAAGSSGAMLSSGLDLNADRTAILCCNRIWNRCNKTYGGRSATPVRACVAQAVSRAVHKNSPMLLYFSDLAGVGNRAFGEMVV